MKKIVIFIFVCLGLFAGWKGWEYYRETYIGKEYYARVTAPLPNKTNIKDDSGKTIGAGYEYNNLIGFDLNGNSRKFSLSIITSGEYANGSKLEKGEIIRIKASKKRIIEEQVISSIKVPASLKDKFGL